MFRKISIKFEWKRILFWEISVLEYWTMIVDYEQFLEEYFWKYDLDYKKISPKNLKNILENVLNLWGFEENILDFWDKKIKKLKQKDINFHKIIWRFMYIFHISYEDILKMPFSVFLKMSEDLLYIVWEKEEKKQNDFSFKTEKQKLKELFG